MERKRIHFWLPVELLEKLEQQAKQESRSTNKQVEYILQQHLAHQQTAGCNEKPGPSDQKGE